MLKQLYALYGPGAPVFFSQPPSISMLGIAGWNQTSLQNTVKEITRDPRQWRQQLLKRLKSSEYVYCSECMTRPPCPPPARHGQLHTYMPCMYE